MSLKKPRRCSVGRSKRKSAGRRPVNTEIGKLVIELANPPARTPADLAKTIDREWFRSHPYRSHRIRRAVTGEFPGSSAETYIVVRQLRPGARQRIPFNALVELPSEDAPEHIAHAMYDLVQKTRGRPILSNELFHLSRTYEVAVSPEDPSHDKPRYRH